ncbi:hypothetical protein AAFF_G00347980 [Aldrovandia affinis]|uniref:Uncharacterized protein n=1 Tax=Aldrovandia affinis TaxID=143900 RepID=A0AAD7SKB9_9TELE|nr:hypothetical protein AAFF_G00347980 [Aldrovandia affinis]
MVRRRVRQAESWHTGTERPGPFVCIQYNECFTWPESTTASRPFYHIPFNRVCNVQQPAPTSDIVMRIACMGVFPDLGRKENYSPKVEEWETGPFWAVF